MLKLAINRLNEFCSPRLHKALPKVELTADDRVYVNMGCEVTTAALAGIVSAYLGRFQMLRAVPAVVPFTSKLGKNHEEFFGVALFIGSLVADRVKESQEAKVEEAHSRADYEEFLKESAQSLTDKVKEVERRRTLRRLYPQA